MQSSHPSRATGVTRMRAASRTPHVLQMFEPVEAGVPAYVAGLTEGLIQRGWRVSVLAPPGNSAMERLVDCGASVLPLKIATWPSLSDIRVIRAAARLCRDDVRLIHGHSTKASLLAACVSTLTSIPSVYTPHYWAFERTGSSVSRLALSAFERRMSKIHREIIAVADSERREAQRAGIHSSIKLVHTGLGGQAPVIGKAESRLLLGLSDDAVVAAWVGRCSRQKRPQDLGPLAASLTREAIQLVAVGYGLAGTAYGDALVAAGGRLIVDVDPQLLYAAADIFVQTSAWEATSLAVLEAMQAGLPVVAYRVGGLPDQVCDGVTGYLVDPAAVDDLASRTIDVARSQTERARLGNAGRRRYEESFSFEQMIDSIESIYMSVSAPEDAPSVAELQ